MTLFAAFLSDTLIQTAKTHGVTLTPETANVGDIIAALPEDKVFELCRILDTEAISAFAMMCGVEVDELHCGVTEECDHVIRIIPVTPSLVAWQTRYANARYVQHLISDHWELAQKMRDDYLKELEDACRTTTPQTSDATTVDKDGPQITVDSTAP